MVAFLEQGLLNEALPGHPPVAPPDPLLFQPPEMRGVLWVHLQGAKQLQPAPAWFDLANHGGPTSALLLANAAAATAPAPGGGSSGGGGGGEGQDEDEDAGEEPGSSLRGRWRTGAAYLARDPADAARALRVRPPHIRSSHAPSRTAQWDSSAVRGVGQPSPSGGGRNRSPAPFQRPGLSTTSDFMSPTAEDGGGGGGSALRFSSSGSLPQRPRAANGAADLGGDLDGEASLAASTALGDTVTSAKGPLEGRAAAGVAAAGQAPASARAGSVHGSSFFQSIEGGRTHFLKKQRALRRAAVAKSPFMADQVRRRLCLVQIR